MPGPFLASRQEVHAIDLSLVKEALIIKDSNPLTSYTGTIFIECRFADALSEPARLCFYDEYCDDADSLAQMGKKGGLLAADHQYL